INGDFASALSRISSTENALSALTDSLSALTLTVGSISADYLTSADKTALEGKITSDISSALTAFINGDFASALSRISSTENAVIALQAALDALTDRVDSVESDYLTAADRTALELRMNADISEAIADLRNHDLATATDRISAAESNVGALQTALRRLSDQINALRSDSLTFADKRALENKIASDISSALTAFAQGDFADALARMDATETSILALRTDLEVLSIRVQAIEQSGYLSETEIKELLSGWATSEDLTTLTDRVSELEKLIARIDSLETGEATANEQMNEILQRLDRAEAKNETLSAANTALIISVSVLAVLSLGTIGGLCVLKKKSSGR
ncbi:MAG: hypothetical protein ACI4U2_00085, partial [Christensenellaceae bacterium]